MTTKQERQKEDEADLFARNIMMPKEEFLFQLGYYSQSGEAVAELSKHFNAPKAQVIKRMKDFDLLPKP